MSATEAIEVQAPAKPPGSTGITVFAAVLILAPLLQWLYLTVLSQFTLLEPPFTHSSGLVLAMQLFFAPGNILAVVLGVGLMRRSDWMRRITRLAFLVSLVLAAVQVGTLVASPRFDANVLPGIATLIIAAAYLWYFGRPYVRQQFQARTAPAGVADAAPGTASNSRVLVACACVEILLGAAAVALTVHLWTTFSGEPLLGGTGLSVMPPEEDLLKMFLFVTFALLLSPHLFTAVASAGMLLGRPTAGMARRYSIVACWTAIGGLLFTVWLATKPEFSFAERNAYILGSFFGVSLAWHLGLLYLLGRSGPLSDASRAAREPAR